MDKKIKIDGINNRYLIKKVNHEKLPEKKKHLFDKSYSHEYQKKLINELYSDNEVSGDDINRVKKRLYK